MKNKKIIYYNDELKDDFAGNDIKTEPIEQNFKFLRKSFYWKLAVLFLYRIIAIPIGWFTCHIIYGAKIYNRKALKKVKGSGVFLYGNHTQSLFDAFMPSLISFPKRNHIITHPDAFSIKGIRHLVQIMGGLPVPGRLSNVRPYQEALEYYTSVRQSITIYPEAHIWPYYTGLRNYSSESFYLPAKFNLPIIAFAVTYRERKLFKNLPPRVNVYVSEPIYPDKSLTIRESALKLRNEAFDFQKEKIFQNDNFEYIKYIKNDK